MEEIGDESAALHMPSSNTSFEEPPQVLCEAIKKKRKLHSIARSSETSGAQSKVDLAVTWRRPSAPNGGVLAYILQIHGQVSHLNPSCDSHTKKLNT